MKQKTKKEETNEFAGMIGNLEKTQFKHNFSSGILGTLMDK